ncbi:MAG: hypothetical protein HYZ16_12205 [Bacteroidetes bacterium]|jgi:hypothetical protein|nr:hypothetical protein [Bacteroidota bacterium]
MKSRQIMFFAVLEDIEQILKNIETTIEVHYYKTGLMDSKNIPNYSSIFDTPNVGVALSGDWNRIDNYLVMKKETLLNIETVPQRTGGIKFAVDQQMNQKSVTLKHGGIYNGAENVIVAGRVATVSEDSDSNELYKLFSNKIKKKFKKIGTFYVGKIAEEKLKEGWRLVTNEKSPREYDLTFS